MQEPITLRTRILLLALPLSGLLFVLGILGRGRSLDPSIAPAAFASAAVAANAALAWSAVLLGMVIELLGICALNSVLAAGRRPQLAFWGMVLSLVGVALVLPLIGFMALAAPIVGRLYLAGQENVLDIAIAIAADGPGLLLAIVSGVAYVAGSICFAIALRGIFPRALIAGYALQAPLLTFVALFSVEAELIGALLLLICGSWIAWSCWRSPSTAVGYEPKLSSSS